LFEQITQITDLFFFENKRVKIFTSAKKCVLGGDFSPKPFGAFFYKTKNFDPLIQNNTKIQVRSKNLANVLFLNKVWFSYRNSDI